MNVGIATGEVVSVREVLLKTAAPITSSTKIAATEPNTAPMIAPAFDFVRCGGRCHGPYGP
ncbi:hypothetical protein GCM10010404_57920 [Nonomuraea africana]